MVVILGKGSMVYSTSSMAQKLEELSTSLLKGHYIFNSDSYFTTRFGNAEKISHNVSYQITEDRELIEQYLHIRQEIYRQAYNDPNVGEDYTDRVSRIFVARAGAGNVIGGIRLTISRPTMPNMLPVEHAGMNLRGLFPQIDFDKIVYGEASRLAVLPDFRDGGVAERLQMQSKEYFVKELGAEIGFGCSNLANMRKFSAFFTRLGYSFIARKDQRVYVKDSEAELYLWAIDFTPEKKYASLLKGAETISETSDVADLQPEFA